MNIAIIDDNQKERKDLAAILTEYFSTVRSEMSLSEFGSGEEFLESFRPYSFGLIFVDIFMNGISGTETAARIRESDPDAVIIFITTSSSHMPEAFRVHAFDYVSKPAHRNRIFSIMNDILKANSSFDRSQLFSFICDRTAVSIPFDRIKTVRTSSANYLDVIDSNNTVYTTRMTFTSAAETLLSDNKFLLVLRGVLVNMEYILDIRDNVCYMKGDMTIPINVKRSAELESIWTNYKFAHLRARQRARRNHL